MSFISTLIILFIATDVLWWASTWRRLTRKAFRLAVSVFALVQLVGLGLVLASRWLNPTWADAMPRPVISAIFLWHLLIALPWLLIFLSSALVHGVRSLLIRRKPRPMESVSGKGMTRREWLRAGVTMAPAVLTAGGALAGEWQLERFRMRRMTLPIAGLPSALDGVTIAHVTDIHIGHFTHGRVLEDIVNATNNLGADLVLMTGDLINMNLRDLPAGIELMKGLRAGSGVFLCEGNHDLFEDPARFRGKVRGAGLPFLLDEAASVSVRGSTVQVLGTAWSHNDDGHKDSMQKLRGLRDPNAFPIVMAHHPHAFDFADEFPLMLSGHTHGGQLMLGDNVGFGPWMFRYWSGEYRKADRALVVSNGTGNWFPVRIYAPAEIIHLTLKPA